MSFKYSILVAEDDKEQFKSQTKLLSGYDNVFQINKEILCQKDAILKGIEKYHPDILLMDIELEDCEAFDIIDELPPLQFNKYHIVLMTNYDNKDYLVTYTKQFAKHLKDKVITFINKSDLSQQLEHDIKNMIESSSKDLYQICQLLFIDKGITAPINLKFADICFLEDVGGEIRHLYYYDLKHHIQTLKIEGSLKEIKEALLKNRFFIELSHGVVINTFHIKKIRYEVFEDKVKDKSYGVLMPYTHLKQNDNKWLKVTEYCSSEFIARLKMKFFP